MDKYICMDFLIDGQISSFCLDSIGPDSVSPDSVGKDTDTLGDTVGPDTCISKAQSCLLTFLKL